MEYRETGFGTRHFQVFLISLAFFKNEWVISTAASSTDGMFATGGFRGMHEKVSNTTQINPNWFVSPTLFTGRLIAAILPLFFCSKYIILVASVVQAVSLIFLPMAKEVTTIDILKIIYLVIEAMTIIQLPAAYTLLASWTPHHEFGRNMALLTTGTYSAFFMFIQIERFFLKDYKITYYLGGIVVFIWSFIWLVFCAPDPHKCFYISKGEKHYLFQHIPRIRKVAINVPVPLKKIFSCFPIYGFMLADMSVEVFKITGRHHKLTTSYFTNSLHFQNEETPQAIATLLILNCLFMLIFGNITDRIIEKGVNLNNTRKTISSIALWGAGISFAFMGYCDSITYSHMIFNISFYLRSLSIMGHLLVPFDIAQNYGGFVIGISRAVATLIFPLLNDMEKEVLRNAIIREVWNYYYYATGGFVFMANLVFLMCGTVSKRDFDNVGTFNWRHESIHSYP